MKKFFKFKKLAFTIIELLIVISIIAILCGIVLVSLNKVKLSAKDARVKADMEQIKNLIQLYGSDKNTYNGLACGSVNPITCDNLPGNSTLLQIAQVAKDLKNNLGQDLTINIAADSKTLEAYVILPSTIASPIYYVLSMPSGDFDTSNVEPLPT